VTAPVDAVAAPGVDDGDVAAVAALLGRRPAGRFEVVVRNPDGSPLVIRNAPLLDDGTPMPTRFWLLAGAVHDAVSRLEAAGGVRAAEAAVDPGALAAAHDRYAAERTGALPDDLAAGASSAYTRTTPGSSSVATIRWAGGWRRSSAPRA
jgi:hypothetical protein